FHDYVTADGAPGPTGKGGFPAERGRYHLYVSLACPWAHRTLLFRKLKKLEDVISISITEPYMGPAGWEFGTGPGATLDTVNGKPLLAGVYLLADARTDYYPAELRGEIDRINDVVYPNINDGVYRTGFATTQAAYETAATTL